MSFWILSQRTASAGLRTSAPTRGRDVIRISRSKIYRPLWRANRSEAPTVIMCAEAVWWRCHRQLISDALVARGIEVGHILSRSVPAKHALTEFARLAGEVVRYPGLV